jgi:hypothetical protein
VMFIFVISDQILIPSVIPVTFGIRLNNKSE